MAESSFLDRHPRVYIAGPQGPSSAAGRYQFTWSRWKQLQKKHNVTFSDFTPDTQDAAAVLDLDDLGATKPLLDGDLQGALKAVRPKKWEWEGFKGKSFAAIQKVYNAALGACNQPK